jgi:hypothetical protein
MTKSHAAAAWAALYGTLALVWTATGRGFPFGTNDPDGDASLLRGLPAEAGAPIFAVVLLATAVAALSMPPAGRWWRCCSWSYRTCACWPAPATRRC